MFSNHETTIRPVLGVEAWRRERLMRAGFDDHAATRLSSEPAVDFHVLLELVDLGCPPHLAARIVAPLDTEGAPGGDATSC